MGSYYFRQVLCLREDFLEWVWIALRSVMSLSLFMFECGCCSSGDGYGGPGYLLWMDGAVFYFAWCFVVLFVLCTCPRVWCRFVNLKRYLL